MDTRYIFNNVHELAAKVEGGGQGTSLSSIFAYLQASYRQICAIDDSFTRYHNNEFPHEAGYDAYMTGCCLATFALLHEVQTCHNIIPMY